MAEPEAESERRKSFYERSAFKATVACVGLLSAVWAFLGPPSPFEAAKELAKEDPLPLRNVEIILDASSRMGEPFGEATKLDVAAEAVGRWAAAGEGVGLALRRAGGDCDERAEPVVGFDDHLSEEVAEEAKRLRPGGRANWGLAIRTAISDFSAEKFQRPGSVKEIVIFVGGKDQCGGIVGQEIRNELEHADLHAQFRFFALKPSKQEQQSLQALKRQLHTVADVEVNNANTVKELYRAVQEDVSAGDGDGVQTTPAGQDDGDGAGGGGEAEAEAGEAAAGEADPEALQLRAVGPQLDEEAVVEPSQEEIDEREEREEREREEEEEEERETEELEEAEEELSLEGAEEAPEAEGDEEAGSLEGSTPVPTPEEAPEPGRPPTSKGRFSLRNNAIPPMTLPWTRRPSDRSGRENLLSPG